MDFVDVLVIALVALVLVLLGVVIWQRVQIRKLRRSGDLEQVINESSEIEEADRAMLKSVFEFGDMITREVMVPRTDMITLEKSDTLEDALKLFLNSGYSRMPVVGEDADEIVGIAYFKDVVAWRNSAKYKESDTVEQMMRSAQFVPESKAVDDLFRMMQKERQHIAMVVDEYGGIAGLVTLEDALEEIVGELDDEHDRGGEDEPEIERSEDGKVQSITVGSRFPISDVEELFECEIEHDDVDTVLGLLTKLIGKVAIKGATAQFDGLQIEAVATSGRRRLVSKIQISKQG